MAGVARIWTSVDLDSSEFTTKLRKTVAETQTATTKMQTALSGIKSSMAGATAAIAGISFVAIAREQLEYVSSLGETAQQLGVTTKALQEWRFIATQTGVSQETMDRSLAKLTKTIGEAEAGGKKQASAFKDLGVSIKGANGELRPTEDILRDLVAGFSDITAPAERARLQTSLFGKSGQELDTLLAGGVDQIDNMREAAHRLGIVISPDLIARADDAADSMSKLQTVISAQIGGMVSANADQIAILAGSLADLTVEAGNAAGAYNGFLRIIEKEGIRGGLKSFFGDGTDQQMARTPKGYADLKVKQQQEAVRNYQAAKRNPLANPVEVRRLAQVAVDADRDARAAVSEYRSTIPKAKPKPRVTTAGGGDGGGAKTSRQRSAGGSSSAGRDDTALQSLYDRLYPEEAQNRELQANIALLEKELTKGGDAADKAAEAIRLLKSEAYGEKFDREKFSFPDELSLSLGNLTDTIGETVKPTWQQIMDKNVELTRSFVDMAQDVKFSMRSLVDGIKDGDVLSLLDGVVGLFEGLKGGSRGPGLLSLLGMGPKFDAAKASAGASATANSLIRNLPRLATGGNFMVGGVGGIDRNVLSINGQPRALVSASERIDVTPQSGMRDAGGERSISFDLRGAVMTTDLLVQMQRIAAATGGEIVGSYHRRQQRNLYNTK